MSSEKTGYSPLENMDRIEMRAAIEDVRNKCLSIVPDSVNEIQDKNVRETIIASFKKAGEDIGKLAQAVEYLIGRVEEHRH